MQWRAEVCQHTVGFTFQFFWPIHHLAIGCWCCRSCRNLRQPAMHGNKTVAVKCQYIKLGLKSQGNLWQQIGSYDHNNYQIIPFFFWAEVISPFGSQIAKQMWMGFFNFRSLCRFPPSQKGHFSTKPGELRRPGIQGFFTISDVLGQLGGGLKSIPRFCRRCRLALGMTGWPET